MLTRDRSRAPRVVEQSERRQAIVRLLAATLAIAALIALLIAIIAVIDNDS